MKNTLLLIISLIVSFEAMAWSVDDSIDNMSGKSIREANALSENQVDLGWPYGIMRGNLSVRFHPRYGRDIIFFVEKGHIPCRSYSPCDVLIRFDNNAPMHFNAVGPSDGSTNHVFIQGFDKFIQAVIKAKSARLSVTFYQKGAPEFIFDVSDFPPEVLKQKPIQRKK